MANDIVSASNSITGNQNLGTITINAGGMSNESMLSTSGDLSTIDISTINDKYDTRMDDVVVPGTASANQQLVMDSNISVSGINSISANEFIIGASGINRKNYSEIFEDFYGPSGTTLPAPWATDTYSGCVVYHSDGSANGQLLMQITAANEGQAGQLTWGEAPQISLGNESMVEIKSRVILPQNLKTNEKIVFGFCNAHANAEDALDGIAASAWFMLKGASDLNIYYEYDDGAAVAADDQDSGVNIVNNTFVRFKLITDANGIVSFYLNDVFIDSCDFSALSAVDVQPIVCIRRSDNSQTESAITVMTDYVHVVQGR